MDLIPARRGHFRFESGHHGSLWLDLDSLFLRPSSLEPHAAGLAAALTDHRVDVVAGPLVGGALLGQSVALHLGALFVYTERTTNTYRLPPAVAPHLPGRRVAVVDDVINAGSATRATIAEVEAAGGEVVAVAALLTLGSMPAQMAGAIPLITRAHEDHTLYEPADCPQCAAGAPLEAG